MKKKIILRALLGIPVGIAIGYTITIIISLFWGSGYYSSAVPELVKQTGSEINAVVLQYALCALLGAISAGSSGIYEMEHWSIGKRTVIHGVVLTAGMMPIAWFAHWMEHTLWGVVSYVGIFLILYVIVWGIQMVFWRKRIKRINEGLRQKKPCS